MQPSLVRGTGATQENYEALGRAQEKVAEIQKRILENRRHETAELYNQLGAARSLVQAEKDRLQDRQVAFGKMDPGRQHRYAGRVAQNQSGRMRSRIPRLI